MHVPEHKIEEIKRLCATHKVQSLYLFGSALSADYNEQSDIDFLVAFQSNQLADYFSNYLAFKTKLQELLGRNIDLVEEQTLKNPILIRNINRQKELIYG